MNKILSYIILFVFIFLLVMPVLINGTLLYSGTPDIQYVKGKILWVMEGELYADPVTGVPTFHPPIYHFLLSLPARMGMDIDLVLLIVSMLNVGMLCFTIFLFCGRIADRKTALLVSLLTPFIVNYMGYGYIFLATAFNFSVPIYLLGLWKYFKPKATKKDLIISSVLWGIAFIISPVYLFLIGFTLLYEIAFRRDLKRFALITGPFLITLLPFYIQAYVVYKAGMANATTFAFWRGIPDLNWVTTFVQFILAPATRNITFQLVPIVGVLCIGLYSIFRRRPVPVFPMIAGAAYFFTAYHYSHEYSIRIYFFLSLFLVTFTTVFLLTKIRYRPIGYALIALMIGMGLYSHYSLTHRLYEVQDKKLSGYNRMLTSLKTAFNGKVKSGGFVLASEETYRFFILPHYPVRGLIAYKSGEYFQLSRSVADRMLVDYNMVIKSDDIRLINSVCNKYGINTCVVRNRVESDITGYKEIARNWQLVSENYYYRVYQRLPSSRALHEKL